MLQAATFLRDHESESTSTPFEDYSLFLYRQNAPEFLGRVKELEQKLLYPVRERCRGLMLATARMSSKPIVSANKCEADVLVVCC